MRTPPPSDQVIAISTTRDQLKNIMTNKSRPFGYGQVISRPMHYGGSITLAQNFFCLDADSAAIITLLAKTISFQEWEKKDTHVKDTHVWFRLGSDEVCVTKTPDGWLAHGPKDQTLTYRRYLIPILFPTAKMAQEAAELCLPKVHPALGWMVHQATAENRGAEPALGWIGWNRVLPEYAWLELISALRAA
jgi:hypothetical protein